MIGTEQAKVGRTGGIRRGEEDRFGSESRAEGAAAVAFAETVVDGVAKWDELAVAVWAERKLKRKLERLVELQQEFAQQGRSHRSTWS